MRFTKKTIVAFVMLCFMFAFTPVGEVIGTNTLADIQAAEPTISKTKLKLVPAIGYDLSIDNYSGTVSWKSSNKNVAVINKKGHIVTKEVGETTITAKSSDGEVLGKCAVTVAYGTKTSKGVKYNDVKGKSYGTTGRWFTQSKAAFTNANGSILYFRVSGTKKVKINFISNTSDSSKKTPVYAYSINGKSFKRKAITSDTIDLGGTGTYYVKVVIDAISTLERRYDGIGVGIKNVVPVDSKNGAVCGIVPENNMIAFYGDSITEGVNSIGASYYPSSCSAIHSYAWYTAEELNATPFICGYASTGINTDGKMESIGEIRFATASTAIRKYTKSKAVKKYDKNVKVVVLEYGTNDTCSSSLFQTLYGQLLKQVRNAYPNALIVCMTPFYKQKYASQIKAAASTVSNVKVFDTTGIKISGYAESLHPTDACAKREIAPRLAQFIKKYSKDF